jgi:formylmethanofuran:tetrahydromethanopterin formyltransferase
MAKAKKPDAGSQTTEIISDAIGDVVADSAAPPDAPKTPKIVIDGVEYDATHLSDPAKGAVASLQFAEAKIMALQNELAICQTAHFAYVKGLKAELEGKAS